MSDQAIRDEIRSAYVRPVSIFGGYGAEHRAELFDAWERRIEAEAWGDGKRARTWRNPYREQNSEGSVI